MSARLTLLLPLQELLVDSVVKVKVKYKFFGRKNRCAVPALPRLPELVSNHLLVGFLDGNNVGKV